jgi:hypothetical protein
MADIASSLEKEFADRSQADRAAQIAELQQIESKGRGSVAIAPRAIAIPLLFGFFGAIFAYGSITTSTMSKTANIIAFIVSVAIVAVCAWAMFGPRKPRFTLTEEGVRVKDVLLPWSGIEDYGITTHSTNGFPTHTTVELCHTADFTPPKPSLRDRIRKAGRFSTHLTLFTGAKGMNGDKLAQRIGEFLAAARARAELARLNAN